MRNIDPKKTFKHLYGYSRTEPELIKVPSLKYLEVSGEGNPNDNPCFEAAIGALYALSYTLKFAIKDAHAKNYTVMPLEGLWDADDPLAFVNNQKDDWRWTLCIMQPKEVNSSMLSAAVKHVLSKKKELTMVNDVVLNERNEELCAHILHVGPYSEEGPTVAHLHDFIAENGFKPSGQHREIYLSDVRRVAPEKLRTIIRQGVG